MPTNPLTYYFGDRNLIINRLADLYGDRLERMPTGHKLLATSVLSGALYELEKNYPDEECSIAEYMTQLLHSLNDAGDATLCCALASLDDCEPSTIATLVMAIAIYAAEEVR